MARFFQPRGALLQVLITISCSSGFFLFGYDQGVFSGVIVTPYFLDTFNNPDPGLLGTINAIYDIGAAVGALICLFFGDALGRKRTITMGIVFASVGAILQGTAKSVGHLIAGSEFNSSPLLCQWKSFHTDELARNHFRRRSRPAHRYHWCLSI
jgi:MFS family permease